MATAAHDQLGHGLRAFAGVRLAEFWVVEVEGGVLLVGAGKGGEAGVGVERAEQGEADGGTGTAGVVDGAVGVIGGGWGVGAAKAVGEDDGGVSGEVGGDELDAA